MIEDEFPPKDLMDRAHYKESIGRVVGVNDIEPISQCNAKTLEETRQRKIDMLERVANDDLQCLEKSPNSGALCIRELLKERHSSDPVHPDAIHCLPRRFAGP